MPPTQRDDPPHFRNRDRDQGRARSRSPRRNGANRYGERDSGYAGRGEVKREPDEGYGAREREKERADDRKRYEDDAVSRGVGWVWGWRE